jgi:hypothetical protein
MKVTNHLRLSAKVKNVWGFASTNICRRGSHIVHKQRDNFIPVSDKTKEVTRLSLFTEPTVSPVRTPPG